MTAEAPRTPQAASDGSERTETADKAETGTQPPRSRVHVDRWPHAANAVVWTIHDVDVAPEVFIPLSVRYDAAEAALAVVARWVDAVGVGGGVRQP